MDIIAGICDMRRPLWALWGVTACAFKFCSRRISVKRHGSVKCNFLIETLKWSAESRAIRSSVTHEDRKNPSNYDVYVIYEIITDMLCPFWVEWIHYCSLIAVVKGFIILCNSLIYFVIQLDSESQWLYQLQSGTLLRDSWLKISNTFTLECARVCVWASH